MDHPHRVVAILFGVAALVAHGTSSCQSAPAEAESPADLPSLKLQQEWSFDDPSSPATDVRWLDRDTLLVLRATDGVASHRLTEGLPRNTTILPGKNQQSRLGMMLDFAASGRWVVASSGAGAFVWAREGGDAPAVHTLPSAGGNISDLDSDGSRLAVLGTPSGQLELARPGTVIWLADVGEEMGEFEPLYEDREAETSRHVWRSFAANAGSLRFSPSGDLLVALGYRPEMLRLSSSGKVKERWDLSEVLGQGHAGRELEQHMEGEQALRKEHILDWLGSAAVVDDVLWIDGIPAAIVRWPGTRSPTWQLVLLEPDAITRYSLPVGGADARDRVKADWGKGGLLLLIGDRGFRARSRDSAGQRVLLLEVPQQ